MYHNTLLYINLHAKSNPWNWGIYAWSEPVNENNWQKYFWYIKCGQNSLLYERKDIYFYSKKLLHQRILPFLPNYYWVRKLLCYSKCNNNNQRYPLPYSATPNTIAISIIPFVLFCYSKYNCFINDTICLTLLLQIQLLYQWYHLPYSVTPSTIAIRMTKLAESWYPKYYCYIKSKNFSLM